LVKDEAVKFFASKFTGEKLTRPTLDEVQFNMITHTQREELTAPFPKGINASFLALIPKTNHPQSFNDYKTHLPHWLYV